MFLNNSTKRVRKYRYKKELLEKKFLMENGDVEIVQQNVMSNSEKSDEPLMSSDNEEAKYSSIFQCIKY